MQVCLRSPIEPGLFAFTRVSTVHRCCVSEESLIKNNIETTHVMKWKEGQISRPHLFKVYPLSISGPDPRQTELRDVKTE